MAGSRVFHSDLGFTRGSTRFSFARAGSPTRRAGMLASNWRLFMGCPYKCCIDYIFDLSMRQYRTAGRLDDDRDTEARSGQIYVPAHHGGCNKLDPETDNWVPNPFIRNAESTAELHVCRDRGGHKAELPGRENRTGSLAITSNILLRYHLCPKEIPSFWRFKMDLH